MLEWSMGNLKALERMAASTLIIITLCSVVVQVNGQCERCGFLLLSELAIGNLLNPVSELRR